MKKFFTGIALLTLAAACKSTAAVTDSSTPCAADCNMPCCAKECDKASAECDTAKDCTEGKVCPVTGKTMS